MPEQQAGNGLYRTAPQMSESPSATTPKPSRSRARAEPRAEPRASTGDGGVFSETQFDVLGNIIAETQTIAERQLREAITALREETEITVAVCRDELLAKIDAKNFGAALLDETAEVAKRAVHALRRDLDERARIVKARLDVVSERLDAFESASKKEALNTWRGFVGQLARQHGKIGDLKSKLGAALAKVDQLGTELRQLRHDLGDADAKPWPETLALPAPSARCPSTFAAGRRAQPPVNSRCACCRAFSRLQSAGKQRQSVGGRFREAPR